MPETSKVLLTAAGPNMRPLLDEFSLPTFERYAEAQGYNIHVEDLGKDCTTRKSRDAKEARWAKIRAVRAMMDNYEDVVWIDADAMICRTDEDVLTHMGLDKFQGLVLHTVPYERRVNPNTGVWVVRSTEKACRFLDAVEKYGMPDGRWADQGAVMEALGWNMGNENYNGASMPTDSNEFIDGTAWLPVGWNQPYCENRPNPEAYVGRPIVPNPNVVHFMAMTIAERFQAMGVFAKQISHM